MFENQRHFMSNDMRSALESLVTTKGDAPSWFVELLDATQVGKVFRVSFNQANWLLDRAKSIYELNGQLNPYFLSHYDLLKTQFDPKQYFLMNSGLCNPSY